MGCSSNISFIIVPELTPTEHERTELIAIRYSFTVLSNIFVYCITWAVLHITNNKDANSQIGPDDADKFQDIVFIGIGTGVVTSILFHIFVKERSLSNSDGSAGSIMLVTSLGVTADFIGQNVDSGAFVYGIMSFTDKLCNGLAVMLIQYLGSWINTKNYYKDVLVYVCSSSAILGLLVILYIKPFHNNEVYNTLSSGQTTALSENESNDILRQDHVT